MAAEEIPREVSNFITAYIDSVEQLNVLILLFKSPEREWTTAEIVSDLCSTESSIERRLGDLYSRQVLLPQNGERHSFNIYGDLRQAIVLLEKTYRERPLRIIEMIYSQPPMALRIFADAFRIRKDEK